MDCLQSITLSLVSKQNIFPQSQAGYFEIQNIGSASLLANIRLQAGQMMKWKMASINDTKLEDLESKSATLLDSFLNVGSAAAENRQLHQELNYLDSQHG